MGHFRFALAVSLFVAVAGGSASPAVAEHPSYLILRTPAANSHHHPTYGYSPGNGYAATTHAYAYGWFGAQQRQHWSRSFGVNKSYTQWSTK